MICVLNNDVCVVFVAESLLVSYSQDLYFGTLVKFTLCLFWRGPTKSRAGGQELLSQTTRGRSLNSSCQMITKIRSRGR